MRRNRGNEAEARGAVRGASLMLALSASSFTWVRIASARVATSCPVRVRVTEPGLRSTSSAPSSLSRSRICIESAGCVTAHCSAACPKWPVRASASK